MRPAPRTKISIIATSHEANVLLGSGSVISDFKGKLRTGAGTWELLFLNRLNTLKSILESAPTPESLEELSGISGRLRRRPTGFATVTLHRSSVDSGAGTIVRKAHRSREDLYKLRELPRRCKHGTCDFGLRAWPAKVPAPESTLGRRPF